MHFELGMRLRMRSFRYFDAQNGRWWLVSLCSAEFDEIFRSNLITLGPGFPVSIAVLHTIMIASGVKPTGGHTSVAFVQQPYYSTAISPLPRSSV